MRAYNLHHLHLKVTSCYSSVILSSLLSGGGGDYIRFYGSVRNK